MAGPALDIVLENGDLEGVDTIVAQVQDLITGKKLMMLIKSNLSKVSYKALVRM